MNTTVSGVSVIFLFTPEDKRCVPAKTLRQVAFCGRLQSLFSDGLGQLGKQGEGGSFRRLFEILCKADKDWGVKRKIQKAKKVSGDRIAEVQIKRNNFHGEGNYQFLPIG